MPIPLVTTMYSVMMTTATIVRIRGGAPVAGPHTGSEADRSIDAMLEAMDDSSLASDSDHEEAEESAPPHVPPPQEDVLLLGANRGAGRTRRTTMRYSPEPDANVTSDEEEEEEEEEEGEVSHTSPCVSYVCCHVALSHCPLCDASLCTLRSQV